MYKRQLQYREKIGKPVWIRHVILPDYTLDYPMLEQMAEKLQKFSCIEKIELLPFHKMGEYKWEALKEPYQLEKIEPPSKEDMEKIKEIFRKHHFEVS